MEAVQGQIQDITLNVAQNREQNAREIEKIITAQQELKKGIKMCADKVEEIAGAIHIVSYEEKLSAVLRRQENLIRKLC